MMAVTKTPFLLTLISTMRRQAAHKKPLVKENTDTRGHTHTHKEHTLSVQWKDTLTVFMWEADTAFRMQG